MNNRESFWAPHKKQHDTKREMEDEIIDGKELEDEIEKISKNLSIINTNTLNEEDPDLKYSIYKWYHDAMIRRDREPLGINRFINHFFTERNSDPTFAFGDEEKGFLLGFYKNKVFIPTHFAPKTMRGGYDLIKNLGESNKISSVMSVTPDLTDMISKIPAWHALDLKFLSNFRNEKVEKNIVYNDQQDTKKLMIGLVSEYTNNSNIGFENDDEDDDLMVA